MGWEIITGNKKAKKKVINKDYPTRKQAIRIINELKNDYNIGIPLRTRRKKV